MTRVFKRLAIVLAVVAALSMLAIGTTYAAGLGNGSSGDGVCDCVCDNQTQAGENGQYGNPEPGDCLCDNQTMTQNKAREENGQNGAEASGDCVQQQTQAAGGEENGQNSGAESGDCAQLQTCQQDQEQTRLQLRACVDDSEHVAES